MYKPSNKPSKIDDWQLLSLHANLDFLSHIEKNLVASGHTQHISFTVRSHRSSSGIFVWKYGTSKIGRSTRNHPQLSPINRKTTVFISHSQWLREKNWAWLRSFALWKFSGRPGRERSPGMRSCQLVRSNISNIAMLPSGNFNIAMGKFWNSMGNQWHTSWWFLAVSTPLKNMKVSWDDDIPNWMEK
jgi:hypothetical protein